MFKSIARLLPGLLDPAQKRRVGNEPGRAMNYD
jgi:hypothetical protein